MTFYRKKHENFRQTCTVVQKLFFDIRKIFNLIVLSMRCLSIKVCIAYTYNNSKETLLNKSNEMLLSSLKGDLILAYRVTPSWAWSVPDTNKASLALNLSHELGCRLLLSLRELLHKMTYNSSYATRYLYHQTHRPTANKLSHASYSPEKKTHYINRNV